MASETPEVATVTSKGQLTIPSALRDEFGIKEGTKLMVVPTEHGLVLKKIDLPTVSEFQERVEAREATVDLSTDEIIQLVHESRTNED